MLTMTNQDCFLVETHLHLVQKIVHYNITIHESIQGLGYDDLYRLRGAHKKRSACFWPTSPCLSYAILLLLEPYY